MPWGQLPDMQVAFARDTIQERVAALGAQISLDLKGQELVVIGVMKGSFIFLADLVRHLQLDIRLDFIGVASYQGTQSTGQVRITHDLTRSIEGQNVLLIEDIVDSGMTIDFLLDSLRVRQPKSMRICTLLSKPEAHQMHHKIDYVGFEITREFVVGYGLDLDGRFRHLPDIMQIIGPV